MIYCSRQIGDIYTVSDSVSGGSFEVIEVVPREFYYDGREFNMEPILGYIDQGYVGAVSKYLINLLGVVESVELKKMREVSGRCFVVCKHGVVNVNKHNIICRSVWRHSILEMLMCASYDAVFMEELGSGVVQCVFGAGDCFVIRFCGDYMKVVIKLVTLYRETKEFKYKMFDSCYLR